MITGIAIENFKGIRERVEIELRPITLLFGANSAGKSSILHALNYAVELFERHNADAYQTVTGGSQLDLGGFVNIVHGHDLNSTVWLKFTLRDDEELWEAMDEDVFGDVLNEHLRMSELYTYANSFAACRDASLEVGIRWDFIADQPHIAICRLYFKDRMLAEITSEPHARRVYLSQLDLAHPALLTFNEMEGREYKECQETPITELFADPSESFLSVCLRDSLEWFQRVSGRAPSSLQEPIILLLEDQDCALPDQGMPVRLSIKSWNDVVPSRKSDQDTPAKQSERAEQERLFQLAHKTAWALSQLLSAPINVVRESVSKYRYLGPIREVPHRNYRPSRLGEREKWASGMAAWDLLATADNKFIETVSQWLGDEDRLNSGYRLKLKRFKELDLSDPLVVRLVTGRAFDEAEANTRMDLTRLPTHSRLLVLPINESIELRPNDVGIGISQVVPVIVTALEGNKRLLAIEQPELHLHPKLQAELADLLILSAKGIAEHSLLLETHSELIPLRIMRRIRDHRDGTLPAHVPPVIASDVAIYYVEAYKGATVVQELELGDEGQLLDPWPEGFFEEGFRERFSS